VFLELNSPMPLSVKPYKLDITVFKINIRAATTHLDAVLDLSEVNEHVIRCMNRSEGSEYETSVLKFECVFLLLFMFGWQ
jgi:hypothetical protein